MTERPETTLEALMEKGFRSMLSNIETGLPAIVLKYDATTQTAEVQPIPQKRLKSGESQKLPALAGVPVLFPGGSSASGKQFAITWPLNKNDPVWLAFSGRAMDGYLTTGNPDANEPTGRRFSILDCVAIPQGPRSLNAPLKSASDSQMVIGEDGITGASLRIGGGKVEIGTAAIGLLDLVDQLITALQSAIVATALGPQPLDPATQLLLTNIQAQLALIKGD